MLAKSLSFMADADAAGIVLGARVPIILTSRADSVQTRLASCAVAALVAQARRERPEEGGGVMTDAIAVLNAGSSSIKFSLFAQTGDDLALVGAGSGRGHPHRAALHRQESRPARRSRAMPGTRALQLGHDGALEHIVAFLRDRLQGLSLAGIGHRVVHGGLEYAQPVRVDRKVLDDLAQFVPLAPLHQPHNLTPIRLLLERQAEPAAGGLLRHGVPSRAAGDRADVRAAQGAA